MEGTEESVLFIEAPTLISNQQSMLNKELGPPRFKTLMDSRSV